MLKPFRTLLAAGLLALVAAAPASAVTYGTYDGNGHPYVGALVGTFSGQTYVFCSGTLISPTVVLTAAHCNVGDAFDGVTLNPAPQPGDPVLTGQYIADARYTQSQNDPHDLAVVVLDRAVKGVTPARLPTRNKLGAMKAAGTLTQDSKFSVVGYGGQETTSAPGGHVLTYEDRREIAVASFNSFGTGYLRLSQNPAHGDGGACYGDSGGPNFFGAGRTETNILAGTTITGDVWCKSTNVTQRLDTDASRAFLGRFVALP